MGNDYIGYLKYSGKLVDDGLFDARKAAQALIGFDDALRFFIVKQRPDLATISFEIPVKIQQGSWEALIPQSAGSWALASAGVVATAYFTAAASKMAENDFEGASFTKLFQKSLKAVQWLISIGKHLGDISNKKIEKVKFEENNTILSIPNSKGEYLKVPKEFLEWFLACPPKLISGMAKLVEQERMLSIGLSENGKANEVSISYKEKYVFTLEEDVQDSLFPELQHGQQIELEGEITRGNEITNSMGFKYEGHILGCAPKKGSIVVFKNALFTKCKIIGVIDRTDELGTQTAKRPKIIFTDLISAGDERRGSTLFPIQSN